MHEIVFHFGGETQIRPIVARQPAQREPGEITPAAEQNDQRHRENESRNGVPDKDAPPRQRVETRTVANGFGDPQRNGHQINDQRRPYAQRNRNGHFFSDQTDNGLIAVKTLAEIELQIVLHHRNEPFAERLIKAETLFEFFDQLRVETLRAAIFGRHGSDGFSGIAARRSGNPRRRLRVCGTELGRHIFDRSSRRQLNEKEIHQHDPEQGHGDQRQTAKNIAHHRNASFNLSKTVGRFCSFWIRTRISFRTFSLSASTHHVISWTPFIGCASGIPNLSR